MDLPNGFDLGSTNSDCAQTSAVKTMAVMLHFFDNCQVEISANFDWQIKTPTDVVEGKSDSLDKLGKAIIAGFLIASKESLWRAVGLNDESKRD